MFDIQIDTSDLRGLGQKLHAEVLRGVSRAVRVASESALSRARGDAPVKNGDLRKSLKASPVKALVNAVWSTVFATAEHMRWVVEGTRPHRIEARRANALHWTAGGQKFFRRSVNHPGTSPNPFLRGAELVADNTLTSGVDRATDEAIERVSK
jgi:hypothetical protein